MKMVHVITRSQAKTLGVKRYFTGNPCRYGHNCERYVNGYNCIECEQISSKSQERAEYLKNYAAENFLNLKIYMLDWKSQNGHKKKASDKRYKQNNPEAVYASNRKRQIAKKQRTVSWQRDLTDFVFAEANALAKLRNKLFGFKWHVDHVLPLCGYEVSGFHVWNNFQVIPASVNAEKKDHLVYIEPFSWLRYYS